MSNPSRTTTNVNGLTFDIEIGKTYRLIRPDGGLYFVRPDGSINPARSAYDDHDWSTNETVKVTDWDGGDINMSKNVVVAGHFPWHFIADELLEPLDLSEGTEPRLTPEKVHRLLAILNDPAYHGALKGYEFRVQVADERFLRVYYSRGQEGSVVWGFIEKKGGYVFPFDSWEEPDESAIPLCALMHDGEQPFTFLTRRLAAESVWNANKVKGKS